MNGIDASMPAQKRGLPENVTEYRDRHGKWRLRFRKKGLPTHHFKAPIGTEDFRAELAAARAAKPQPSQIGNARIKPGSIAALIAIYYGSPAFTGLRPSSRRTYRNMLERFRVAFGDLSVRSLTRQRLKAIIGKMADRPSAANNLLDRLRILMLLAIDNGWISEDPTYKLKGFDTPGSGFHTWTEDEITQFKETHPAGSKPRRALILLLYTTQRRGDVVGMGRQHRSGNRIAVIQGKTGATLSLPLHPDLEAELALAPRGDLTYLVTEHGAPYSAAGFGNWFRRQCDAAKLPQCSAHGLRKAGARRMAEAGKTHAEIKSITGHITDKEVSRYIRAADQKRLSDHAIDGLDGAKSEQTLANLTKSVGEPIAKV